jgi:hypothetical protein
MQAPSFFAGDLSVRNRSSAPLAGRTWSMICGFCDALSHCGVMSVNLAGPSRTLKSVGRDRAAGAIEVHGGAGGGDAGEDCPGVPGRTPSQDRGE